MSKKFSTFAADKFRISTRMPSTSNWAVSFWAKPNSSSAVFKPLFYRCNNGTLPFLYYGMTSAGLAMTLDNGLGDASSGSTAGSTLVLGRWYHFFLNYSVLTATAYVNGVNDGVAVASNNPANTNDMLMFGGDDDTDAETGLCSMAAIKIWQGGLLNFNAQQISDEMNEAYAVRRQYLYAEFPLETHADKWDRSDNCRVADTCSGTLTDVNPPTVNFNKPQGRIIWQYGVPPVSSVPFDWRVATSTPVRRKQPSIHTQSAQIFPAAFPSAPDQPIPATTQSQPRKRIIVPSPY